MTNQAFLFQFEINEYLSYLYWAMLPIKIMMKNEEKINEEKIKFQSKSEIAACIAALTPFCGDTTSGTTDNFALAKIKELTKLL